MIVESLSTVLQDLMNGERQELDDTCQVFVYNTKGGDLYWNTEVHVLPLGSPMENGRRFIGSVKYFRSIKHVTAAELIERINFQNIR